MAELVAKVYSQALFDVGLEKDSLDLYLEEIKAIVAACHEYPDFFEILKSPKIKTEEKKHVFLEVFGTRLSEEMNHFIKILLDKRRLKELLTIAKAFEALVYEHKGIIKATAYTTRPLGEEEAASLQNKLAAMAGKQIELNNQIDENLLGGVMIKLGDKVIDGTLKGRLNKLQSNLKEIIV